MGRPRASKNLQLDVQSQFIVGVFMKAPKGAFRTVLLASICALILPTFVQADPLKIGYSDWPGYTAWQVAIEKGWFKDAGVDVQFTFFEYGPSIDAFTAGKIDAVCIVPGDAMVSGAGGKASTGVCLLDFSDGNDMIIGKPGINSIKDLKGKTVAVEFGLVEHELLLKGLEANGLSGDDVKIQKIATNDAPQTLASGKVDAVGCWYPISGQTLKQVGGSKALYTSADSPGLIYDELAVSKESLAAHRDEWKKVVGVWFKTVAYIMDPATHDEAIKIMAAKVNVPLEDYSKSMKGTHLLGEEENLKRLVKNDSLESIFGSLTVSNAFYIKYQVYKDSQDPKNYVTTRLVEEVTGKKPGM
jgi:NitT/TauT family transport system substrate-binding protein